MTVAPTLMPTDMRSVKKETTHACSVSYSLYGRNSFAVQPAGPTLLSTPLPNQASKTKMRSHFPQTLAPLSPSMPSLPICQCGSAAPQQPLALPNWPKSRHPQTIFLRPHSPAALLPAPHTTTAVLHLMFMGISSQIPEAHVPCSALTYSPPPPS